MKLFWMIHLLKYIHIHVWIIIRNIFCPFNFLLFYFFTFTQLFTYAYIYNLCFKIAIEIEIIFIFFYFCILINCKICEFVHISVIVERKLSLVSHPNLIVYYAQRNRHGPEDSAYTRKLQNWCFQICCLIKSTILRIFSFEVWYYVRLSWFLMLVSLSF